VADIEVAELKSIEDDEEECSKPYKQKNKSKIAQWCFSKNRKSAAWLIQPSYIWILGNPLLSPTLKHREPAFRENCREKTLYASQFL
jgi:hypothetical protein